MLRWILPAFLFACLQTAAQAPSSSTSFDRLTFHSTACHGSCPIISLTVYPDSTIELYRQLTRSRSRPVEEGSGYFRGKLNGAQWQQLLYEVANADWSKARIDSQLCCDIPVRTLILTSGKVQRKLHAILIPAGFRSLVEFLMKTGVEASLPAATTPVTFESISKSR